MSGVTLLSKSRSKEHHPSNQSTSSAGYSGVKKALKSSGSRLGAFYSAGPVLSLGGPVQAKMKVGHPDDPYEREADSAADRIMTGGRISSISRISPEGAGSAVQRQEEEENEEEELIQARNISGHSGEITPSVESHIQTMKGRGEPLAEFTRAFFEPRFGRDFSGVRVHTDNRAAEAARVMNARAFTVGEDIVFGAGQYTPGTSGGQRLLAHEMTHVVQQKGQGREVRKKEDESNDAKLSWWERKKMWAFEKALNKAGVPERQVMGLINRAGSAITEILKYPGRFVNTLIQALGKGFQQFNDNIGKHLKAGFMNWLFGTMIKAGIDLPANFSPRSILTLVLQVLGITQALIRQKVVKVIGEKNVSRIEKAWHILSTFMKDGIGGLWEMLKDYLSNLKKTVVGEVRKWVTIEVIKVAVMKVVSMFNPVSGLITIIKTIYKVIEFLIERASQIMALFNAITGSVVELAMGNITKAANKVEDTLARLLPLAIGFMANLLGIGGIAGKIKEIIRRIQARVHEAIDKVIRKVAESVRKVLGKNKDKREKSSDIISEVKWAVKAKSKKPFKNAGKAQRMIDRVFAEYQRKGLRSLRIVEKKDKKGMICDIIASASPEEDVGDLIIFPAVSKPSSLEKKRRKEMFKAELEKRGKSKPQKTRKKKSKRAKEIQKEAIKSYSKKVLKDLKDLAAKGDERAKEILASWEKSVKKGRLGPAARGKTAKGGTKDWIVATRQSIKKDLNTPKYAKKWYDQQDARTKTELKRRANRGDTYANNLLKNENELLDYLARRNTEPPGYDLGHRLGDKLGDEPGVLESTDMNRAKGRRIGL